MKKFILALFILPFTLFSQEDTLAKDTTVTQASTVNHLDDKSPKGSPKVKTHTFVDQQAEFPGGQEAMAKFIAKNFKYPPIAIETEIQGKVFARFIIDKKGKVSDVKILRPIEGCEPCSKEVIRVIELMPKWKPAKIGNQKVRSYYDLPVKFTLN